LFPRRFFRAPAHLFQIVDSTRIDCGADQAVLSLQPFGEDFVAITLSDQILIRRALAGQDRATDIDE
jgi:hypothetical protein